MNTLVVTDVLKKIQALPSLPAVVLDLLASMEQPEVDIDTLARKIALDQALTAKTLRLANSSFYGMQRQVTTVSEAIAVLGLSSVRNLATTAALVGALSSPGPGGFDFMAFWRHAIGTALCARSLAAQTGLNPEQAYVAGLLHDIGRLVLATQFSTQYAAVTALRAASDSYLLDAERAVLALDHAVVGAALAQHWKFPELMQQVVAQHHDIGLPGVPELALVVHLADAVAHALDFSMADDDLVPLVADATWLRLGLDEQKLRQTFRDAERQFDAACGVLAA